MSVRDNEVINLNTDEEIKKVLDLLGLTGDTGGSAAAGTAMAKLNELQKKLTAIENTSPFLSTAKLKYEKIVFDSQRGEVSTVRMTGKKRVHGVVFYCSTPNNFAYFEGNFSVNIDGKVTQSSINMNPNLREQIAPLITLIGNGWSYYSSSSSIFGDSIGFCFECEDFFELKLQVKNIDGNGKTGLGVWYE